MSTIYPFRLYAEIGVHSLWLGEEIAPSIARMSNPVGDLVHAGFEARAHYAQAIAEWAIAGAG